MGAEEFDAVFKKRDTYPTRRVTLIRNGQPWDTTGAVSGRWLMVEDVAQTLEQRAISFVTPRTGGQVDVHFLTADVDTEGDYNVEVELLYTGSEPMTFPSSGYRRIKIVPDLG
jgi:hypothetical protein